MRFCTKVVLAAPKLQRHAELLEAVDAVVAVDVYLLPLGVAAAALQDAIDTALLGDDWQYEEAWKRISTGAGAAFQSVLRDAANGRAARGRGYGRAMKVQRSPFRTRAANASDE